MDVIVRSVKDQAAADSMWENLKGAIKGMLANPFIPPVSIEAVGNNAILDFGQAVYMGAPHFTFSLAKNLVEKKEVAGVCE